MAKKGAYGKRYSTQEQAAIVADWQSEGRKAEPRTQMQFCKDNEITVVTLNRWRKLHKKVRPVVIEQPRQPEPQPVKTEQAVVALDAPRAVAVIDGGVADWVEQIRQHQASMDELRAKLHAWVDTL
jgi:hypothetical protein